MLDQLSDRLGKLTGLVNAFKEYSKEAAKNPLPFIKGTIILGAIIIFIILTLIIYAYNPNYYEFIFFAILIVIVIILIMSFHIKVDQRPEIKKMELIEEIRRRDAITYNYPDPYYNPQLELLKE